MNLGNFRNIPTNVCKLAPLPTKSHSV